RGGEADMNGIARVMTLTACLAAASVAGGQGDSDHRSASLAAFERMASVIASPRCLNCHPVNSFPTQSDDQHRQALNGVRGVDGGGVPGMRCTACHGRSNNPASGVPGAEEDWRLAPLSMGWQGLSRSELCRQLTDPARNGGRSGAAVIDHLKTALVLWAWHP